MFLLNVMRKDNKIFQNLNKHFKNIYYLVFRYHAQLISTCILQKKRLEITKFLEVIKKMQFHFLQSPELVSESVWLVICTYYLSEIFWACDSYSLCSLLWVSDVGFKIARKSSAVWNNLIDSHLQNLALKLWNFMQFQWNIFQFTKYNIEYLDTDENTSVWSMKYKLNLHY